MHRQYRPSVTTIAMSAVATSLMLAVGMGSIAVLQGRSIQRGELSHGAAQHHGADLGPGPLDGIGLWQDGGLLQVVGPLQGNMPILAGALAGWGGPIAGADRPPLQQIALVGLPPNVPPATPIIDPGPSRLPDEPTPPSDPDPLQQPQTACVTCFVPPPPPSPTPPPNNIVNCANVTCN